VGVEALGVAVELDGAFVALEALVGHADRLALHFIQSGAAADRLIVSATTTWAAAMSDTPSLLEEWRKAHSIFAHRSIRTPTISPSPSRDRPTAPRSTST
jgi:hypothetical protein